MRGFDCCWLLPEQLTYWVSVIERRVFPSITDLITESNRMGIPIIAFVTMSTKHILQTLEHEKARIVYDSNPLNKVVIGSWENSLNRIRVQLKLNTDSQSIVNQLEKELMNYAWIVNEFTQKGLSEQSSVRILLDDWGRSLRVIYDKLREDNRFCNALNRMIEKLA